MKDLNSVVLTGILLKDPSEGKQYFVGTTGVDVFRTQLLVKKAFVTKEDKYDAGLVNISAFGKLAKAMVQNLQRGEKIAIRGRLGLNEQEEVIVEELIFVEKKEDAKQFAKSILKYSKPKKEGKKGKVIIKTSTSSNKEEKSGERKNSQEKEKRVFPE